MSCTTPTPVQPYPDRGGSYLLDESSMTLTPARKPTETAPEIPVQDTFETSVDPGFDSGFDLAAAETEPTLEQEPR